MQVAGTKAVQVAAPAVKARPLQRPQGPSNQVVERKRKADATLDALAARPAHANSGELTKAVSMAHVSMCQMKHACIGVQLQQALYFSTPVSFWSSTIHGRAPHWGGYWQSLLSNSCNRSVTDMSTFALQYVCTQYRCDVHGDNDVLQMLCICLAVNTINGEMRYTWRFVVC